MNIYEESVAQALDEHGIEYTIELIRDIVGALDSCREYASYGHGGGGYNYQEEEIKRLKKELLREQNKRVCGECKGSGIEIRYGPYHSSTSSCFYCGGKGFVY